MTRKEKLFNAVLIGMYFTMGIISVISINERNELIKENAQLEIELNTEKKKWTDFNKSYVPETALPRIKEIEDIYLKG